MKAFSCNTGPFAVIGIAMAFFFAMVWIVAASNDPNWSLGVNTLSDMGISDVQLTADLFMYGCMIAGALAFVFGLGKAYNEANASRASGIMVAFAGVFLILVGLYNKDYGNGNLHQTVAMLFFFFLTVAAALSVFGDWAEGKRVNAVISATLIVIVIGAAVGNTIAYVEAVAVICGLLWIMNESVKMILNLNN